MEVIHIEGKVMQFNEPAWIGNGFAEAEPDALWKSLPENLRQIGELEVAAGNHVTYILQNLENGVVVLGLQRGPLLEHMSSETRIHTSHAYGNYCYEGTSRSIEDLVSGCFVTFDDPSYERPAF